MPALGAFLIGLAALAAAGLVGMALVIGLLKLAAIGALKEQSDDGC